MYDHGEIIMKKKSCFMLTHYIMFYVIKLYSYIHSKKKKIEKKKCKQRKKERYWLLLYMLKKI